MKESCLSAATLDASEIVQQAADVYLLDD